MTKASYIKIGLLAFALSLAAGHAQNPNPTPPPTTSVQIVNATSVPAIALSLNGEKSYPKFSQGRYTADAPTEGLQVRYSAEDLVTKAKAESEEIRYENGGHQSIILLGDFTTLAPPGTLLQPGPPPEKPEKPNPPNILYRVYQHDGSASEAGLRLRVINGMPGKELKLAVDGKKVSILPGSDYVLQAQAPITEYLAEVDGAEIPFLMRQEGVIRNAMAVFFLKGGQPAFMRVFENK